MFVNNKLEQELHEYINSGRFKQGRGKIMYEYSKKRTDYNTYGRDFIQTIFAQGVGGCLADNVEVQERYNQRYVDICQRAKAYAAVETNRGPFSAAINEKFYIEKFIPGDKAKKDLGVIAQFIQNLSLNFTEVSQILEHSFEIGQLYICRNFKDTYIKEEPWGNARKVSEYRGEGVNVRDEIYDILATFCYENNFIWRCALQDLLKDPKLFKNKYDVDKLFETFLDFELIEII